MIAVVVRRVRFALAILLPAAAAATIVYVARPEPGTRTVMRTDTVIAPVPVPLAPPPPPVEARVTRGVCAGVPAFLREAISDQDAAELAARVTAWTTLDRDEPPIAYRRGVAFAEGEEDRGDDPPYPKSAAPESTRACGTSSLWLRSALRDALAQDDVVCDGNVCCYTGLEYMPAGLAAFRKTDAGWTLDTWAQSYDVGPDGSYDTPTFASIEPALKKLAKLGCPGEPAGADY